VPGRARPTDGRSGLVGQVDLVVLNHPSRDLEIMAGGEPARRPRHRVTGGHLLAALGRDFPGAEVTPDELPAAAAEEVARRVPGAR
jgi:hypothetical protein